MGTDQNEDSFFELIDVDGKDDVGDLLEQKVQNSVTNSVDFILGLHSIKNLKNFMSGLEPLDSDHIHKFFNLKRIEK